MCCAITCGVEYLIIVFILIYSSIFSHEERVGHHQEEEVMSKRRPLSFPPFTAHVCIKDRVCSVVFDTVWCEVMRFTPVPAVISVCLVICGRPTRQCSDCLWLLWSWMSYIW